MPAHSARSCYRLRLPAPKDVPPGPIDEKIHDFTRQICGVRSEPPNGAYSEGAHIRPLGRPHNGPDKPENVLCLCPNHHVLFDAGAFAINPDTLEQVGIVGKLRTHRDHAVGREHLEYRMEHFLAGAPALSAERS